MKIVTVGRSICSKFAGFIIVGFDRSDLLVDCRDEPRWRGDGA